MGPFDDLAERWYSRGRYIRAFKELGSQSTKIKRRVFIPKYKRKFKIHNKNT